MKRVKNSAINFRVNPKLVYLQDFSIKFYTVNAGTFFIRKTQDDVVEVEREATIYDEDVIESGGTTVKEYFIKLDWHELLYIGEGVLNWRAINNVYDTGFFDTWYNRLVEGSTEYYIDSDIFVDPAEEKNISEKLVELDERITIEVGDRTTADTYISGVVDSYIASNDEALANEIARAISAETDLNEALSNEVDRATTREVELTDLLNNLRQDLTDESEIRSSADTSIWNALNSEVLRATSAETKIANDLTAESLRATNKEDAISGKLDTYIASNDAALAATNTALSNEVTRATGVESVLSATIVSNYDTLTTAIANEKTRSEGQETALNAKIDAETTRATAKEDAISGALDTYKVSNNTA